MTRRATEQLFGPVIGGTPMIACSPCYYISELLDGLLRVVLCALRMKPFATNALGPTHSGVTP